MNSEKLLTDVREGNFTAVDFETANERRVSVCSMGVVVVRNGAIYSEHFFLVRPIELRFTDINTRIHGLTAKDVMQAPNFNALWPEIEHFFEDQLIVAHNAEFDIDVLRQVLRAYNLNCPPLRYACTQKMAQEAFHDLKSYRLSDVAAYMNVDLDHHNSLSDARASAHIGIRAMSVLRELPSYEYEELTDHIVKRASETKKASFGFEGKHIESELLKPDLANASPDSPFFNKKVVFTGHLQTISRKDAAARIQALGADIDTNIGRNTQIVILGQKAGPAKLKKIEELRTAGRTIRIIEEQEFLTLITQ